MIAENGGSSGSNWTDGGLLLDWCGLVENWEKVIFLNWYGFSPWRLEIRLENKSIQKEVRCKFYT